MAAAIRNQCRRDDPAVWGEQEIIDSFALLPLPSVQYTEWSVLVGGGADEPQEVDPLDRIKASGLIERGVVNVEQGSPCQQEQQNQ